MKRHQESYIKKKKQEKKSPLPSREVINIIFLTITIIVKSHNQLESVCTTAVSRARHLDRVYSS